MREDSGIEKVGRPNDYAYYAKMIQADLKNLPPSLFINKWAELFAYSQEKRLIDSLTKFLSKPGVKLLLRREIAMAKRTGAPLSVLMIDLDFFKKVNDTLGHIQGDEVIRSLAHYLKNKVRRGDIIGRYGGDEFTVLLPNTNIQSAVLLAERLRGDLRDEKTISDLSDRGFPLSMSIGVAKMADNNQGVKRLLKEADSALYRAKEAGRNNVVVYEGWPIEKTA